MTAAAPLSDDAMIAAMRARVAFARQQWGDDAPQHTTIVYVGAIESLLACWDAAHPTSPGGAAVPGGETR